VICTVHQIYSGDQIKENEMGGTRSTYMREEKLIQGFGRKPEENRPRGISRHR